MMANMRIAITNKLAGSADFEAICRGLASEIPRESAVCRAVASPGRHRACLFIARSPWSESSAEPAACALRSASASTRSVRAPRPCCYSHRQAVESSSAG